jgi:hypothetical protein
MAKALKGTYGEDFLKKYLEFWYQYKMTLKQFHHIFEVLNSNFLNQYNTTCFKVGFELLKEILVDPFKQRLFDEIFELVKKKRRGDQIDLNIIRGSIAIFETTSFADDIEIVKY